MSIPVGGHGSFSEQGACIPAVKSFDQNGILRCTERSRVERSQLASSADLTGLDFFFAPF